jgi:hypothetical protein
MVVFGFLLLFCHPAFFPRSETIPTPAALLLFHLLRRVSEHIHILKTCESHYFACPLAQYRPTMCRLPGLPKSFAGVRIRLSQSLKLSLPAANGVIQTPQPDFATLVLLLRSCNDARPHLHRFCNMWNEARTCRALIIEKTAIKMKKTAIKMRQGIEGQLISSTMQVYCAFIPLLTLHTRLLRTGPPPESRLYFIFFMFLSQPSPHFFPLQYISAVHSGPSSDALVNMPFPYITVLA